MRIVLSFLITAFVFLLLCEASLAYTYRDTYGNTTDADAAGNVYYNNQQTGYIERTSTSQDTMNDIDRRAEETLKRCLPYGY